MEARAPSLGATRTKPDQEPPQNKSLFASFSSEKEESFFLVLF
jgi:hypothetical protein